MITKGKWNVAVTPTMVTVESAKAGSVVAIMWQEHWITPKEEAVENANFIIESRNQQSIQ